MNIERTQYELFLSGSFIFKIFQRVKYMQIGMNKKGEIDPSGNGVWTFKDDCYNIRIEMLNKFK